MAEALKLNRCPILNPKEIEELDRIKRLNRLLGK
tara:strand:+ start:290 stop:391 length:102 start_codon:yes stop_codon:yes gene_type:complete